TEARDLRSHHPAPLMPFIEQVDLITQRRQVARHGKRGRATADKTYLLAVLLYGRQRNSVFDVALIVGSHTFQPAYCHGLLIDPATAAGGLTRTVARAAKNTGKNIRFPIDHVGVVIPFSRDEPDVFRHGCMGRTRVLAIDHLVEILRITDV